MKSVMYHYVRPQTSALPGDYYHLALADFRAQLDYFADEYGFVTREEFTALLRGDRMQPPGGVLLTFDDGLWDHYEYVYPELAARGLWGLFFVPTGPLINGTVLDVHRTHVLLGETDSEKLLNSLLDAINEEMIADKKVEAFREYTYAEQDSTEPTKRAKRILNFFIDYAYRNKVLTAVEDRLSLRETDVSELYMTADQLRTMHEDGMVIGSHSVSHPVFSKLSDQNQRSEIVESFGFLESVLGEPIKTFCYPYGGEYVYTEKTRALLREHGCRFAFTTEARDTTADDCRSRPLQLPRHDCSTFPHGEASGMTN